MRLVRLSYDAAAGTLGQPETLIEGLIAGDDHNAGRLKIGPDGMLYGASDPRSPDDLTAGY